MKTVELTLEKNNRYAEEIGFFSAIDSYFLEIVEGMKPEYFPNEDLQILRKLGSQEPESELRAIIYIIKKYSQKHRDEFIYREISIAKRCNEIKNQIDEENKKFFWMKNVNNMKNEDRPGKRWFKGLGQILQGAAISIANIGLAAGWLRFPVSPETQTYGAFVSVTTGVGLVLNGVGDLRGE